MTDWLKIEETYLNDGALFERFFSKALPTDFYFVVVQDEEYDSRQVFFVPIVYWDHHGFAPDAPLFIDHLVPSHLNNPFLDIMWVGKKSKVEIEQELAGMGFVRNDNTKNW